MHAFLASTSVSLQRVEIILLAGYGVLSALALVMSLRRDWVGVAGLTFLLICSALSWCGTVASPIAYNATHYPGNFGFGLTALVMMELLAPVLVVLTVLADSFSLTAKRRAASRQRVATGQVALLG